MLNQPTPNHWLFLHHLCRPKRFANKTPTTLLRKFIVLQMYRLQAFIAARMAQNNQRPLPMQTEHKRLFMTA